jgi:hypothetical protein
VIRCALGLDPDRFSSDIRLLDRAAAAPPSKHAVRTIIIEAEMVAYNERTGQIDEFWRISNLKHGVDTHSSQGAGTEESTQTTHESQMRRTEKAQVEPGPDKRHYMLVFFDVLELNGTSFLRRTSSQSLCGCSVMSCFLRTAIAAPPCLARGCQTDRGLGSDPFCYQCVAHV